ncbi:MULTISPECIES: tagaturonate reductase [Turicibacter]|jgi:tagaturonate reductase|uniref:Tagaturonate reductase n=3 Tax=Turicibacter sanguinis TaxID=154288 RepID=A0A9X4XFQ0_9FIRM|nr:MULTISPECIES: tagaturonate reductase [Turicibacter]EFF63768.1 mannitol dehydrogenase C-terminal domain protein [Turicibacter sanguinis PC909]MBP3904807.1 tagaturonate reductase [Turicibacter sp.]MCU7191792.1 tagaturonate reductase [Turicibacter sanguinis]MCU7212448.1 tagaturonate reductase [Turicibacter sanguinis]MDB8438073.1 tagaturonate reductase [Turicibacter sanguinis]
MKALNNEILPNRKERPIKIVQFGEGNFLRAFVDWMIQELNDAGVYNGNIAVVQPQPFGRVKELAEQNGLYTVIQEGVQNNEFVSKSQIIDSISEFIDPYMNFEAYLQLAEVETLELMISNTTEAGIVLDESDSIEATPPKTFPGKVLAFLLHRYRHFNGDLTKGLYIVPCELIDNNGDELHRCVKRLAEVHHLEEGFMTWLDEANTFTNTLVDRIVPGYPAKRIEEFTNQFGYLDKNMVLGEVFHLWVIEDRNGISSVLKGAEANLNILFVKDIKPYKIRKVRILNGLHTLMVPVSYLYGIDTVGETMNDDLMLTFLNHTVEDEMIPATERYLTADELRQFAKEVYDRFNNPRVRHELMSIALNSTSKFKSRLLPTALDYVERFGKFPTHIEFSLASLLVFFRGKRGTEVIALQDEADFLEFYRNVWNRYEAGTATVRDVVTEFLGMEDHWEMNLNEIPNLTDELTAIVEDILSDGMETALKKVC